MNHLLYFTKQVHSFAGKMLYVNLIGMVLISLFEGIGMLLLIPLINISGVLDVKSSTISYLPWLSHFFPKLPKTLTLASILLIYVVLIVGQSIFQRRQTILNVGIQQGFVRHLREETYKALLQANWSFFLNKRKSDIINLMTNEITRVNTGIYLFLQFLTSFIFTIIQLGIAFWLSAKMTLFVLLFGVSIIWLLRKMIKRSSHLGKETYELSKKFLGGITDQFNGIKDIKSNMLEESHLRWFRGISRQIENNTIKIVKLNTISQLTYKVVSAFLIAIFVFLAIKVFQAQPAEFIIIVMVFSRLWPRFSNIQSNLEQLGTMAPSFKALIDLQNQCNESQEIFEKKLYSVNPITIQNGIECKNVYFRYNPRQSSYALNNINLKIPANLMTAIVGRSGAGKSTLIDLLMGLNKPECGEVLIDGKALSNENLLSLRRSVSYVPQEPFLFNATIKENLLVIDQTATEERIWEALEFASAAEFVKNLPKGLNTLIGDRGIKLSGGERQRLVLARAILRKPAILILDEATSALDTENESKIQDAIEQLKGRMTIIVIAHRLSTIRNADQVVVLDQGEIIQQGKFNQLASEKRGLFSRLLNKQMNVSV